MSKLSGRYPGGPRREDHADVASRGRTLDSAEEIGARMGRAAARRRTKHRQRRAWSILAAAVVLAGGTGLYLGFRSHRSSEELTEEREAERTGGFGGQLSEETNRMLMELWRMEDVEYERNRPRP